ncbi:MAG: prepilin peptidase [Campylobacterales bacterium]
MIIVFLIGAAVGSFLNVVIYRIPREESVISPPSHCPHCNTQIKPWHNIPILSWLLLRGKCAYCGAPISPRYPIIELTTALLFLWVYCRVGDISIFLVVDWALFSTLLALSVIDLDYKAVPDSLNLLALTLSFFHSPEVVENFKNALLLMGGAGMLRFYVSYFVGREALGEGDLIVAGTIGGLLGVKLGVTAVVVGALLALPFSLYFRLRKRDLELPFVPFLATGAFLVWAFKPQFLELLDLLYG